MLCDQTVVIIFVLLETGFEIEQWKVSALTHLYELSLDEGKGFLLVEVAIAIVVEVVPDVFHAVADDFMDWNLFNTVVLAIWSFFLQIYLHI